MIKLRMQIHLSLEFTAKRLQGKLGEASHPCPTGSCARPIEQAGETAGAAKLGVPTRANKRSNRHRDGENESN